MSEPRFVYSDANNRTVSRTWPDGKIESCSIEAPVVADWLAAGNTPDPVPSPTPEQVAEINRANTIRADAGRADLLNRLRTATSSQIDTWVDANVTNVAQARTVLKAIIKAIAFDGRV